MARALARWVRQLPSGKWNLNIRLKGHGTYSRTYSTRELAEAASLKFQQKLADGTVAEDAKDHEVLTLKEALEK